MSLFGPQGLNPDQVDMEPLYSHLRNKALTVQINIIAPVYSGYTVTWPNMLIRQHNRIKLQSSYLLYIRFIHKYKAALCKILFC